jgi:hypothetical protein
MLVLNLQPPSSVLYKSMFAQLAEVFSKATTKVQLLECTTRTSRYIIPTVEKKSLRLGRDLRSGIETMRSWTRFVKRDSRRQK